MVFVAFVLAMAELAVLTATSSFQTHALVIEIWDGKTRNPLIASHIVEETRNINAVTNRLILSQNDELLWNDEPIDMGTLVSLLHKTQEVEEPPMVEFEPDANASYEFGLRVLGILKWSGAAFGIAGLEKHCRFDSGPWPMTSPSDGSTLSIAKSFWIEHSDPVLNMTHPNYEACEETIAVNPRS